jgi:hypothetical protein
MLILLCITVQRKFYRFWKFLGTSDNDKRDRRNEILRLELDILKERSIQQTKLSIDAETV